MLRRCRWGDHEINKHRDSVTERIGEEEGKGRGRGGCSGNEETKGDLPGRRGRRGQPGSPAPGWQSGPCICRDHNERGVLLSRRQLLSGWTGRQGQGTSLAGSVSPHLVDDGHQRHVEPALPEGLDRPRAVEAADPHVQLPPQRIDLAHHHSL